MSTFPYVALETGNCDDVESVQWYIAVMAISDVPDQDTLTVVVVGGLSPRTWAGNVASAYVEPLALGMPGRYVSHNPLLYCEGVGTLKLKEIALRRCICTSDNKV
tara:strand:+ start:225 stop:539 length:315 start_codon:yes stop_codon:yes gene_type:complete